MRPLSGRRILELNSPDCPPALRTATALAGRVAADMGAEVVRLTDEADAAHWAGRGRTDRGSPEFMFLNAGKRLAQDAEASTLIRVADAVILDEEAPEYASVAPKARVVLSMAGRRVDRREPVSEFTAMATSGLLDLVGDPTREPLRFGGHQLAHAAGLAAFTGLMACIGSPDAGAREVEVSLVDVAVWLNWKAVVSAQAAGRAPSRSGQDSEWQVLRCADGWVAFVYRDWNAVLAAITDPRLGDPRFRTRNGRREHSSEIADIVGETFIGLTRREISELAREHRIPLGPVWTADDIVADEQYAARAFFHDVSIAEGGQTRMPRLPVMWNGGAFTPGAVPWFPAEPVS